MKEIWKNLIGYEGYYQVSNLGNVRSVERKTMYYEKRERTVKSKVLKKTPSSRGYLSVSLCVNRLQKTMPVHKLVAITFLNHIPCGMDLVINHIDFNKQNNNVSNLEVITARENSNHKKNKSSSKYRGVSWHKASNKWCAQIVVSKKKYYLGVFKTEIEAFEARLEAEKKYNIINKKDEKTRN